MKQKIGKIIIVEGLWGVGKSSISLCLKKKYGFSYIKEPNHIISGLKTKDRKKITRWYIQQHFKNLKDAFKQSNRGLDVVVERSPISSFAFADTCLKSFRLKEDIVALEQLMKNYILFTDTIPYLFYLKAADIKTVSVYTHRSIHTRAFSDLKFLKVMDKKLSYYCSVFAKKNLAHLFQIKSGQQLLKKVDRKLHSITNK